MAQVFRRAEQHVSVSVYVEGGESNEQQATWNKEPGTSLSLQINPI
ncbi:MAG: hypothetical protein ACR2MX_06705 [Cyclobacteriaceae bacterium]